MERPLLELRGIRKEYSGEGTEATVLHNLNFAIGAGEYISIAGPSGSGKSTLLNILGLLDTPTSGEYLIKGTSATDLNDSQLADLRNLHFGFVFQSFHLIDELTVYENVALPLRYRRPKLKESEIEAAVIDSLQKVDLHNHFAKKPSHLSGGQQQRVSIARSFAGKPSVLLVDEPTGNLDSTNGDRVMDILDALNKEGTAICLVTHDPRYAGRATTHYRLLDGVLSSEAKPHDVSSEDEVK